MKILPQKFYFADTTQIAKDLLGKILCVRTPDGKIQKSRIVETEAYLGLIDAAAHSFGDKRTNRTQSMYLDGGHSYVYMIYGMYFCLNVVTKERGHPEAILIRAVEPIPIDSSLRKKDLKTNGPGKLCRHYHINKEQDGVKLWRKESPIYICEDDFEMNKKNIVESSRIGVDYAGEAAHWPLRFYIKDNIFVSKI